MFQRIRALAVSLAVYGLGDVVTSLASFLLLPLYVRYLSPSDYGVISLLLTFEAISKIVFRCGLDSALLRLFYDCPDEESKQRLASTIFGFLFVLNGIMLAGALLFARPIAEHLFGAQYTLALRLTFINTFITFFYFIPYNTLRSENRPGVFVTLSFSRTAATLIARVLLVVGADLGVLGVVLADSVVITVFTLVMARWFKPLLRFSFSGPMLREALRFGLPRLPHGIAHQLIAVGDRYFLSMFVTLRQIGIYSIGATFGLTMKLFLSAFEYAWVPFYYRHASDPDAKHTFAVITTYTTAVLVLLAAGLSAVGRDLLRLMTTPAFFEGARIIPFVAVGVVLQGFFQLTSIGINITKRTAYAPIITGASAVTSIGTNLLLIPRFGIMGAAWANVCAYAVMACVGLYVSQRLYPIAYEWNRIGRVVAAGLLGYAAAQLVPSDMWAPASALIRGTLVTTVFAAVLLVSGFLQPRELNRIRSIFAGFMPRRRNREMETTEMAGEIVPGPPDDPGERL